MKLLKFTLLIIFSFFSYTSYAQTSSLSAQEIYEKNSQAIFTIYGVRVEDKKLIALGSAIAVTPNILATNCHVATKGNYLAVKVGSEAKIGMLAYHDNSKDLCLVEVNNAGFKPVTIRDSKDVKIGEDVFAIGNPRGLEKTLSRGIISNRITLKGITLLQTDAAISSGSSGGGLFDASGKLIGITLAIISNASNIGFAIPAEYISTALTDKEKIGSLPLSSPALTSNPNSPSIQNLNLKVKYYGDDQVGLVRAGKNCFIYLPGKNSAGQVVSSIIWRPNRPHLFLLFPKAQTIDKTFKILLSTLKTAPLRMRKTTSNLLINNTSYPLLGNELLSASFPILIAKLPLDPTQDLISGTSLSAELKDKSDEETITFGVKGLKEAVSDYNEFCL